MNKYLSVWSVEFVVHIEINLHIRSLYYIKNMHIYIYIYIFRDIFRAIAIQQEYFKGYFYFLAEESIDCV